MKLMLTRACEILHMVHSSPGYLACVQVAVVWKSGAELGSNFSTFPFLGLPRQTSSTVNGVTHRSTHCLPYT